jgi:hypothetical protein
MIATLRRKTRTDVSTIGVLEIGGISFVTLELPWRDNLKMISCIPAGTYQCTKRHSPSRGIVYAVNDVPCREHILIHVGNFPTDTQGCILIGLSISSTPNMIQRSKSALADLFEITGGEPFTLTIED